MRILIIILLLTYSLGLYAQEDIVGRYRDYFGNRMQLNADSTFKYTWNFDLATSWTKGIWSSKNDTIYFNMIPTYDTLSRKKKNSWAIGTPILSSDETAEHISTGKAASIALSGGGTESTTSSSQIDI